MTTMLDLDARRPLERFWSTWIINAAHVVSVTSAPQNDDEYGDEDPGSLVRLVDGTELITPASLDEIGEVLKAVRVPHPAPKDYPSPRA